MPALSKAYIAEIKQILKEARAYNAVNYAMVEAYWLIGRRIVDLVLYIYILKCFVLIDLKTSGLLKYTIYRAHNQPVLHIAVPTYRRKGNRPKWKRMMPKQMRLR
jgi:hypothetical protein